MAEKSKMSLTPPQKATTSTAEAFVERAGEVAQEPSLSPESAYPWEQAHVREDVSKSVNLRLPEPYHLKLQFLSEKTHKSQQVILREVVLPEIDRQVDGIVEGR
ncbi:MAG: hypothetical protein AAF702_39475 [Chloroflexota bacterium]